MFAVVLATLATGFVRLNAASVAVNARSEEPGPMTKVVQLLKGMQKDLEREAKADKETYESLKCWCDKYKKEKEQAVEDSKQAIDALDSKAQDSSASTGELGVNIETLKRDIAATQKALKEAQALRDKEYAAFHAQEKEMIESIKLLHGAITALSKHHPAMLQSGEDNSVIESMRPALRHLVHQHLSILGWLQQASPRRDALLDFLRAEPELLDPEPGTLALIQQSHNSRRSTAPFFRGYAPQSGQVFGVLKQMKEDFEADLPEIQKDERKKANAYAALKGAKESELKELKDSLENKMERLGTAKSDLFEARNDREDVKAILKADQAFLIELTKTCMEGENEYTERTKMRAEEIKAVSEAIAILTEDSAMDGQRATFSFVQLRASKSRSQADHIRARASAVLQAASAHSPEFAFLAVSARTDSLAKVMEAIDKLREKLEQQQADEVKHRDFCIDQLDENEVQTKRKEAEVEKLSALLEDLESKVKVVTTEIETLKKEIYEMQVELQRASEDRKAENLEFQRTVAEQITAKAALQAAYEKLASVYHNRETFLQAPEDRPTVPPAPEFKSYQQHSGSNHVMALIKKLIGEAQVVVDGSNHAEQEAEAAYETLISETNEAEKAKRRLIVDKTAHLEMLKETLQTTAADKERAEADIDALAKTRAELHKQCDFLLKNFAARQEARAAEMEALAEVKAILSGQRSE